MRAARHRLLLGCVLAYAAIAGLRTVADFDLGWQIAIARHPWLAITGGEALSYTAPGAVWIYPPLAGLVFRALFAAGAYPAISWFCCAALLATVALVSVRSRAGVLLLMLLAMPALADQMLPRSGLFTVVLAAAFSRILLARRGLFLLPLLMLLWVNLHPGFVAGLALLVAAIVTGSNAWRRRLLPWAAATAAATLVNPWGWRMFQAVWQQERPEPLQAAMIRELQPLYQQFSWGVLRPQEPLSSVWWILAASIAAVLLLAARRRFGRACWLAAGWRFVCIPLAPRASFCPWRV